MKQLESDEKSIASYQNIQRICLVFSQFFRRCKNMFGEISKIFSGTEVGVQPEKAESKLAIVEHNNTASVHR